MMRRFGANRSGFTLVEVVVVVALVALIGGYVAANLPQQIARWRIQTSAQQVAATFQRARLEAVRRNEPATVEIIDNRAVARVGTDLSFEIRLEGGVEFRGPEGEPAVYGFGDDDKLVFRIDGTAEDAGAFRLAGARNLFMEVRIDPPATGRTEIRKWDPVDQRFEAQGEGGVQWTW
jgi:prepilin-type N-terminal cleavage/methylation domain-containing protein